MTHKDTNREIAESTNTRRQPLQKPLTGVVPTHAFAIQLQPREGPRRRLRFTERTDGPGWWELEEEWTDNEWRTLGRELLMHVVIEQIGAESTESK